MTGPIDGQAQANADRIRCDRPARPRGGERPERHGAEDGSARPELEIDRWAVEPARVFAHLVLDGRKVAGRQHGMGGTLDVRRQFGHDHSFRKDIDARAEAAESSIMTGGYDTANESARCLSVTAIPEVSGAWSSVSACPVNCPLCTASASSVRARSPE